MPIRIASLKHKIQNNGARLHLAAASRAHSHPADQAPSALEVALLEERRLLKEARAKRQAEALLPKPKAVKLVKEPKAPKAPKAPKEAKAAKEPKDAKAAKGNKPSRAEKVVKKAESLEAAKRATKKSAKT
jgi:hypothetical protein